MVVVLGDPSAAALHPLGDQIVHQGRSVRVVYRQDPMYIRLTLFEGKLRPLDLFRCVHFLKLTVNCTVTEGFAGTALAPKVACVTVGLDGIRIFGVPVSPVQNPILF